LHGTEHPKLMLSDSRSVAWPVLEEQLQQLREACLQRDVDLVRHVLATIVPEFQPPTHSPSPSTPADAVLH